MRICRLGGHWRGLYRFLADVRLHTDQHRVHHVAHLTPGEVSLPFAPASNEPVELQSAILGRGAIRAIAPSPLSRQRFSRS